MSHGMRKAVYAMCEQQRRKSACVSAQSDQYFSLKHFLGEKIENSKIRRMFDGCEVQIENSIMRVIIWHQKICLVTPNSYPE